LRKISASMSERWISGSGKPRRGKATTSGPPVHDDLCTVVDKHGVTRHVFTADAPNMLWLNDITEHRTAEGEVYVCAIKDVYSTGSSAIPSVTG